MTKNNKNRKSKENKRKHATWLGMLLGSLFCNADYMQVLNKLNLSVRCRTTEFALQSSDRQHIWQYNHYLLFEVGKMKVC